MPGWVRALGRASCEASGCSSWSNGLDEEVQFGQAAIYADRTSRVPPPGDLPIQPPTIRTNINLTAAQTLGIKIPIGRLLRADEVIE
jgi:hypothetical protein